MTLCSVSLIAFIFFSLLILVLRKPSKKDIKKFENQLQNRSDWSNMGF